MCKVYDPKVIAIWYTRKQADDIILFEVYSLKSQGSFGGIYRERCQFTN